MNGPNKLKLYIVRLAMDKHSSLLGQFLTYEENKMLWIPAQEIDLKEFYEFLN